MEDYEERWKSAVGDFYNPDPRMGAIKGVLENLTDEGGRIFSPKSLDDIAKRILFWIDEVGR